jgi:hypothetical protein
MEKLVAALIRIGEAGVAQTPGNPCNIPAAPW